MTQRRYPVGIQTFSEIVGGGYVYVDKTDLMWEMQRYAKYIFLSRPRRFGKSLLSSTLDAFFSGRKDLFQGLKVMEKENDWNSHPVLHLDLSVTKSASSVQELEKMLTLLLQPYVEQYGAEDYEDLPGSLFGGLIRRAYKKTGRQVVVIVDEYDAPLLDVLDQDDLLNAFRDALQRFYIQLKASESMIRFCFITGITKFSQLSIFSTINNLTNISLDPRFSAICGITEAELDTVFADDISHLAEVYGTDAAQMRARLKAQYDGYRFSRGETDIYNPFSLLKCFLHEEIADYWFDSGTPAFLLKQLQRFKTDFTALDGITLPASAFDRPTESMLSALPILYQSGYLTIKDYDTKLRLYTLAIPNQEVRVGLFEGILPLWTGLQPGDVQTGFAANFWNALVSDDIDLAMRYMQSYLAGIPYVEGFKEKLSSAAAAEGFYEYTFYLIFSMLNVYASTQVKCHGGRIDLVVWMEDRVYVFELKVRGSAAEALRQIDEKGYAIPYQVPGKMVTKVGVKIDPAKMTVEEWLVSKQ